MSSARKNAIVAFILVALLIFAIRLVIVQVVEGPELAADAQLQRSRVYTIKALRGDILDSSGKQMATTVKRYNIGVNQIKINTYYEPVVKGKDRRGNEIVARDKYGRPQVKAYGPAAAAQKLAKILDKDPAELGGKLTAEKPSTFVYIAKEVTPEVWRRVQELGIPGIEPEEITKRIYPNGNVAGNIIGFTNTDGTGLAGLELSQDSRLSGVDGKASTQIGRKGQVIPVEGNYRKEAVEGQSLQTSISLDLQNSCQQTVANTKAQMGAYSVMAEVEEVGTGRILALCESDTVNPSKPTDSPEDLRGSRAVSTVYEPGSTMKVHTIGTAIQEGKVTPSSTFTVPGEITMSNGQSFVDSHSHPTQNLTTAGIIADSSNTGTVQIGDLVKDSQRYEKYRELGFGQKTGVELPGESSGIMPNWEDWDGRQRYTTMFGQGVAATLLQVSSGMATVANGGVRVAPHLIDSWTKPEGTVEKKQVKQGTRVYSQETARELLTMMEGVVSENGGAKNAQIEGYRVAGKTGTTQILAPNGTQLGADGSFSGIFPANNPRVVITVVVHRPRVSIFGSVVAVPAFKEIANATIRELGIVPTSQPAQLYPMGG